MTTIWRSLESLRSNSIISTPRSSAFLKEPNVFSLTNPAAPRCPMISMLLSLDLNYPPVGSRDCTFHRDQVSLHVDINNFQISDSSGSTHTAGHAQTFAHVLWETSADSTNRPRMVMAVRSRSSFESVSFNRAGKPAAFHFSRDFDQIANCESINFNLLAFGILFFFTNSE